MVIEPVLGLFSHMFSTPRVQYDWQVATVIIICTILYVTRIAGISVLYGWRHKTLSRDESVEATATADKARAGATLVG